MPTSVWLFVPNVIGYLRILFTCLAFYNSNNYVFFYWFYFFGAWADAVDGQAARYFNQTSRFGAVLDMMIDRCATAALLVMLTRVYPQHALWWAFFTVLDFASHYTHMYSTLLRGKSSHKTIDESQSRLLRLYYSNRLVLGLLCSCNEGFFLTLFACHFSHGPLINVPGYGPVGFFVLFTAFCFPMMVTKQTISVIQWYGACCVLVDHDQLERQATAAPARSSRPARKSTGAASPSRRAGRPAKSPGRPVRGASRTRATQKKRQ